MSTKFDLEERLLDYAADIVRFTDQMKHSTAGAHVAAQLLRSGTAALPSHGEAQAAESAADFVHKMSLGLKELRESHRWLRLAQRVPLVQPPVAVAPLLSETDQLVRIFYASIATAKQHRALSGGPRR